MKKVYLVYDVRDIKRIFMTTNELKSFGYEIVLLTDTYNIYFDENDENVLLILNYHGVVRDSYLPVWLKFFYKKNQTIVLLNDISNECQMKYIQMKYINDFYPLVLDGDINKMKEIKNNLLNYFSKEELLQLKKLDDLYAKAFVMTATVFKNKKDKGGEPYFNHLFRVSQKLDDEKEQVAGLLHDILEDTEITEDDLKNFGIPQDIIDIVKIVTKPIVDKTKLNEEERLKLYDEEINKIIATNNIHAIRLKYADMTDNFNPDRINKLPKEKQEWFNKKYGPQLVKLKTKKEGDYYDRY